MSAGSGRSRDPALLEALGLGPPWVRREPGAPASTPGSALTASAPPPEAAAARPGVVAPSVRSQVAAMDWEALEAAIAACGACALGRTRQRAVPGVGDRRAGWLFVGEGPGAEEDQRGEPFVGQAGRLLDSMLAAIGLRRGEDVYIANIVKCRPPGNRNPEAAEAGACLPFLERQIELLQPRLIVALGRVAVTHLLGSEAPLSSLRGRLHAWRDIPVLVTYHPAYLLRNLPEKARAWEDLCLARDTMARLRAGTTGAAPGTA